MKINSKLKKAMLFTAIAVATLGSINVKADIAVTNMQFASDGSNYATSGSLTNAGDGVFMSLNPFLYIDWTATQNTGFMDSSGSWNGSTFSGGPSDLFDYDAEIAGMSVSQIAVGFIFNWNNTDTAILEIFDCAAGICTGNGVQLDNGPFVGQTLIFSGTQVVPVPAAVWLMGSGLIGLIGLSGFKRRKQHD